MQQKSIFQQHIALRAQRRTVSDALSGSAGLTCLFGSFAFLQYIILGLANHAGEGFLSTEQRELVYYALQVFVILGFLLYAAYARIFPAHRKGAAIRKGIAYAVFGLFFACAAVMLFAGSGSLFYVIVSMAAALCLGGIGGAAHDRMSMETASGADTAKCMGIGSAAAVVLQYLLQIRRGISPLLPFFMLAAFFLVAFLLPGKHPEAAAGEVREEERTPPKRIVFSILITAVFILFICFYNEYIHHLQIQSAYEAVNAYSWPRLMLVPGYLLFAVIGGKKKGKYVPIATLCIMLIALLNVVLTGSPESHWLNMCLFYCSLAACTSFYLLTLWRLAPGTGHPALWAPFGRILDSAMVLLTGAIHLSTLPAPLVLGVDIVGMAAVILLMAAGGSFTPDGTGAAETPAAPAAEPQQTAEIAEIPEAPKVLPLLSPEETLQQMQEHYHLTPREAEVLRELVLTDDKQTVISERLNITVKTLQAYVTRLYRKTGTATRAGLTDLYHGNRTRT